MVKEVREININHIKPHPDNPRKDIGDVSELAKSIKVNGIMQNLTVVPAAEGYKALIGHRRLAAAKMAGLETVPCVIIEGLSLQEQVAIMLEENMQRQDLTILEQADSFRLMFDLGATMDDLKESTGFSESTIRRRMNLTKLDRKILQESMQYQISLTDYDELAKIDDIEQRNMILADSRDHNQIVNKVAAAVREKKRKEHAKKVLFLLESQKIKEAPEGTRRWDNNVALLHEICIDDEEKPRSGYKTEHNGEIRYIDASNAVWNPTIAVVEIFEVQKQPKPEPTQKELNEKELKSILKAMKSDRKSTVDLIIAGKVKYKGKESLIERLYKIMEKAGAHVGVGNGAAWMSGKYSRQMTGEETQQWKDRFMALPIETRMMIIAENTLSGNIESIKSYDGTYDEEDGALAGEWYEILKDFGLQTNNTYKEVLDGSSHLYVNK